MSAFTTSFSLKQAKSHLNPHQTPAPTQYSPPQGIHLTSQQYLQYSCWQFRHRGIRAGFHGPPPHWPHFQRRTASAAYGVWDPDSGGQWNWGGASSFDDGLSSSFSSFALSSFWICFIPGSHLPVGLPVGLRVEICAGAGILTTI